MTSHGRFLAMRPLGMTSHGRFLAIRPLGMTSHGRFLAIRPLGMTLICWGWRSSCDRVDSRGRLSPHEYLRGW
jgi:hypothetical protein